MKNKHLVFGTNPLPNKRSLMREKHMSHISQWIKDYLGLDNEVTPGKINAKGQLIKKPNWSYGKITYEPNPDAAVHEVAHLFLAPMGVSLSQYDTEMRDQFGYVIKQYGYLKQKRSLFEVLPMAMEQKIRRMVGLPASDKHLVLSGPNDKPRRCLETNEVITNRIKRNGKWIDLIRCARLLDKNCIKRLEMIQLGVIKFDVNNGWYYNNDINAKINRRYLNEKYKTQ